MGSKLCSPIFLKDTPSSSTLRELDRLLHPRVPPLVRAPPHIELLSRADESVEEQEIRNSLHLSVVRPSSETTDAENRSSIPASAPAPLPLHSNSNTSSNVDEPKTPAPAPVQQSPLHPQVSVPPDPKPASVPPIFNVSSPAQIPTTGRLYSNDALCLPQAKEIPPQLMSGVVTATEGSHLGTALEATNAVQGDDDDDDDDEEMPSIDMASDSE